MIPSRERPCKRCGRVKAAQARGLCQRCWRRHRDEYPLLLDTRPKGPAEPTEAELDALIAEQMRPENLPPWWDKETSRA